MHRPAFDVLQVGRERSPLLVIDDFLPGPERLVEFAARAQLKAPAKGFYPGARAVAPPQYLHYVVSALAPLIAVAFGFPSAGVRMADSYLSMVTTAPERLNLDQRLPHVDTVEPGRIAVLHYLCRPEQGGTSLYRHRSTQFETLDPARLPVFHRALNHELHASGGLAPAYMNGSTQLFERTHKIDAAYNRLVAYTCNTLHCADIPADFDFDPDPRKGRLTANTFMAFG